MDNATYATLARQSGLRKELHTIAHNVANASTKGFQREALIFSEVLVNTGDRESTLSMAAARSRVTDQTQGQLLQTNGEFDFAIEGSGYFLLETDEGLRITRNGSFSTNANGELVSADGARLLDLGQSPIFVPNDAGAVHVSSDGTISIDGDPLTQIGIFEAADPLNMRREAGARFYVEGEITQLEAGALVQGFIEESNVNPVLEISRLIEVQRAYENGKNILDSEDDRVRNVIRTLSS